MISQFIISSIRSEYNLMILLVTMTGAILGALARQDHCFLNTTAITGNQSSMITSLMPQVMYYNQPQTTVDWIQVYPCYFLLPCYPTHYQWDHQSFSPVPPPQVSQSAPTEIPVRFRSQTIWISITAGGSVLEKLKQHQNFRQFKLPPNTIPYFQSTKHDSFKLVYRKRLKLDNETHNRLMDAHLTRNTPEAKVDALSKQLNSTFRQVLEVPIEPGEDKFIVSLMNLTDLLAYWLIEVVEQQWSMVGGKFRQLFNDSSHFALVQLNKQFFTTPEFNPKGSDSLNQYASFNPYAKWYAATFERLGAKLHLAHLLGQPVEIYSSLELPLLEYLPYTGSSFNKLYRVLRKLYKALPKIYGKQILLRTVFSMVKNWGKLKWLIQVRKAIVKKRQSKEEWRELFNIDFVSTDSSE